MSPGSALEVLYAEGLCTREVQHEAADADDDAAPVREYLSFTFVMLGWHGGQAALVIERRAARVADKFQRPPRT